MSNEGEYRINLEIEENMFFKFAKGKVYGVKNNLFFSRCLNVLPKRKMVAIFFLRVSVILYIDRLGFIRIFF